MVRVSREQFLSDRQGRTFGDVLEDPDQPFGEVLAFFSDPDRQRRMEESEIHHNRPPLAGVIRELESQPSIDRFFRSLHPQRSLRLRQAIGVLVRMIMEQRGWSKTGQKGSLGVRAAADAQQPRHNTGGLALWFIRAERYVLDDGMPFSSVKRRHGEIGSGAVPESGPRSGVGANGKQVGNRTVRRKPRPDTGRNG